MPCHSAKANSPRPGRGTLLHALGQKVEHPWLQQGCSAASYPSQSSQNPREGCYHHSGQHKHAKCNRSSPPFEFFPSRSVPFDLSLLPTQNQDFSSDTRAAFESVMKTQKTHEGTTGGAENQQNFFSCVLAPSR